MESIQKLQIDLGEKTYNIIVGEDYLEQFSFYIKEVYKGEKLFIITDSNINKIYK